MDIKEPWIFFGVAAAVVAYICYMIIRRRKGLRPGHGHAEGEL